MTKTILVIDDNDDIRRLLQLMLQVEGYQVLDADTMDKGLRIIHDTSIDIVITDLLMPDKDGLELITELRRDLPEQKIIAISAGGRIGPSTYLDMAKKLGADRVFSKPFDQKEIVQAVEELLT
ncbi:MAG: response regulator [Candidatus Auribacterota bacterium]|nr:response regulator [Candidatus Auribacterota bacterium]